MNRIGYEHSDVSTRSVLWFAAGLSATLVVVFLVIYDLQRQLTGEQPEGSMRTVLRRGQPMSHLVHEPPLQGTPTYRQFGPAELTAIRQQESQWLSTYGCVDRDRGLVRIPIQRAMKLVVERGVSAKEGSP